MGDGAARATIAWDVHGRKLVNERYMRTNDVDDDHDEGGDNAGENGRDE